MKISEDSLTPQFVGTAEKALQRPSLMVDLAVFLTALLGHLPALGAWWNQDDWAMLGRAAHLLESGDGFPARFVSQQLYWDLTWPLFGTNANPHAVIRLLVFGLCAVLVTRIAHRAGLKKLPRLIAGLLVAATPLVFTPLYWAAGIQELLGAAFALGAVERWLAGSRRDLLVASTLAMFSILSKESGLGLGLVFLVMLFVGVGPQIKDRAFAWAMCFLVLIFAMIEGVLLMQHFPTGSGELFAMGGAGQVATNLGTMGWWMLSPGPLVATELLWPQVAAGAMLFLLWGFWALAQLRQDNRLPLITLTVALLSIIPVLALTTQMQPYHGFLAVCAGSIALASMIPVRWKASIFLFLGLSLATAGWAFLGFETRLNQRGESGLPSDPLVRATSLSWQICRILPQFPLERQEGQTRAVTMLQIPMSGHQIEMANRLGDGWVTESQLYKALGGNLGPRLILGKDTRVNWVNALFSNPQEAIVLCETGIEFKHWGNTGNASIYAALTDIGMGNFERARKHLMRAAFLNEDTMAFAYDPSQMIVSEDLVLARKEEFIDWTVSLLGPDHSTQEVGGLQDLFFNVLNACSGISIEELRSGSTLIVGETPIEEDQTEEPKGTQVE